MSPTAGRTTARSARPAPDRTAGGVTQGAAGQALDRGKVSASQLALLFITSRAIPPAVTMVTVSQAKNDAWIAELLAPVAACGILALVLAVAVRFPGEGLIEYTGKLFGPVLGKALGLMYLVFFVHIAAYEARQFGDIMTSIIPETPLMVFIGSILFVAAVIARGGVETLGRFGEMAFPISLGSAFLVFLLSAPKIELVNLLPVMEEGVSPVLRGASLALVQYAELLPLAVLFPFVNRRNEVAKYMTGYIFCSGVAIAALAVAALGIYGSLVGDLRFPGYYLARSVNLANIVQRLEGLALAIWLLGFIVKISIFLYVTCLGLGQLLATPGYKPFAFPLALMVAVLSVAVGENIFELSEFFRPAVVLPYALLFQVGLPLLTLAVASAKGFKPQPIPHGDESV